MSLELEAKIDTGFRAQFSGEELNIAVVDHQGNVIAQGPELAARLFKAACAAYEKFWLDNGTLKAIQA